VVVLLAATAGWTAGQRVAEATALQSKAAAIQEQLERIPTDVNSGNTILLQRRLESLLTVTPAVPQVPQLVQTATALYLTRQPTITPTLTITPTPSPTVEVTEEILLPESTGDSYDLDAYLRQAEGYIASGQFSDATALLDVIISVDSTYQTQTVNRLMLQALRADANRLYNENKLAEAIFLTKRAESFGLSQDDPLRYERYAAELYLDAVRTLGTDLTSAIRAWTKVYDLGQGRYYEEASRTLFQQYVNYGDAWVAQNEYCPALTYYQTALTIRSSGEVSVKRDSATQLCLQATPTLGPGQTPGATQAIAPVGVIETPPVGS
jgi:tetratricopeptide (TPR) repeat protein